LVHRDRQDLTVKLVQLVQLDSQVLKDQLVLLVSRVIKDFLEIWDLLDPQDNRDPTVHLDH